MTNKASYFSISFWAQNLDNISPDMIEKDGHLLNPNVISEMEVSKRILYEITNTKLKALLLYKTSNVELYNLSNAYFLQVLPIELDNRTRKTPIVCYIKFNNAVIFNNKNQEDEPISSIYDMFYNFINSEAIKRHLSKETDRDLQLAIEEIKKNVLKTKNQGLVLLLLILLLGTVIILILWAIITLIPGLSSYIIFSILYLV